MPKALETHNKSLKTSLLFKPNFARRHTANSKKEILQEQRHKKRGFGFYLFSQKNCKLLGTLFIAERSFYEMYRFLHTELKYL